MSDDFTLRTHRPGDIGWVISRHGELYAREYGWDMGFEALVAEICTKFLQDFNSNREICLIADSNGERLGSAFVVDAGARTSKLRLVLVEPHARGRGIGRALIASAINFAHAHGYGEMVLWTNDILHAARRLYIEAGFVMVAEERHRSFGHDLVGQTWRLELTAASDDARPQSSR